MHDTSVQQCPLCQSPKRKLYFKGTQGEKPHGAFEYANYACTSCGYGKHPDIVQCLQCQLIYSSKRPSENALKDIYSQVEDETYLKEEQGRVKTFTKALDDLQEYCPSKGKMFEFGSYVGVYVELAKQRGWDIVGSELSSWARGKAKEKRDITLLSSVDDLPNSAQGTFDSVVLWDVIEHVADPVDMIQTSAKLLKKGGVLGLSTMVLDSLSARLMKKKYPFLMEMHLIYFTRKTLYKILERAGFEVVSYKRHKRFVSLAYLFSRWPQTFGLLQRPTIKRFLHNRFLSLSAGVRDVYARKIT